MDDRPSLRGMTAAESIDLMKRHARRQAFDEAMTAIREREESEVMIGLSGDEQCGVRYGLRAAYETLAALRDKE